MKLKNNAVTATYAKQEFADILNRATYAKQAVTITKHGKPVAVLVDIDGWKKKKSKKS